MENHNSPQLENGYAKISNELIDAFCKFRIRGESWQVLMAIIRKTYGWSKKEDWIAHSQIVVMTGMHKGNVSRELSKLITQNIVIRTDNKLRLNKNYEEWVVIKSDNNKKLSKLIEPVIKSETKVIKSDGNNKHYTKETITTSNTNVLQKTVLSKPIYPYKEVKELQDYFLQVMELPEEDGNKEANKANWRRLLEKSSTGVPGVKFLIDQAKQNDFFSRTISSGTKLWNNRTGILQDRRSNISRIAVMPREAT